MGQISYSEKFCFDIDLRSIRIIRNIPMVSHFGQDVLEDSKEEIESENADIFNYLVKLVDLLDIDLEKIALKKIDLNSKKYPIEKLKEKYPLSTKNYESSYCSLWRQIC